MDFDFGQVSELLGSMSEEELNNLQEAAQSLFSQLGGESDNAEKENAQASSAPGFDAFGAGMFTPELLAQLTKIMGSMNARDPRTDLILALRPHLSRRRQKRAEQAVQMMKMLDLLPALQSTMRNS